jgi:hypothetical protein
MRLAGIPARVVVGYLGGEYNEYGRFFVIRQGDTHAWCEDWLPEKGWQRVDPTSVVAPERVNLGIASFLARSAVANPASNTFARNLGQRALFTKIRLAWDSVNYAWDTRVLSFDAEEQQSFLTGIGINDPNPLMLLGRIVMMAAALLGIYGAWMRLHARSPGDRVKALYERFCRKAARLGAQRRLCEGPLDFSSRAADMLPEQSNRIRNISDTYIALRYSREPMPAILDTFAREVNAFGRNN